MNNENLLISKILQGDIDAFSSLVRLYQNQLFSFLYKLTHSREETEDLLQEVFIRVYNYLYKYNNTYSFSTWIYRITYNTYNTAYKKKKSQPVSYSIDDIPQKLFSLEGCPEKSFETKEQYLTIMNLIDSLNSEQKTVFLLRHVKDFSFKEISTIMDVSQEASRMKYHRAKKTLARNLEMNKKRGLHL